MSKNTLTITDNRTGKSYEIPIEHGTIPAMALRQIKVDPEDFGLMTYDPGYANTASCKSTITYIDGEKGILRYRGYPIEQLAEKSTFLEVAYLLIYGELPTKEQYEKWVYDVLHHTFVHQNLARMLEAFRYDAHPMSMLISALSILSTFHPEARNVDDPAVRNKQILRILGKLPTVAAFAYRHRIGRPYNYPRSELDYTTNFLYMLDYMNQTPYEVNPVLAKALDVLFILHADHEQNCSTSVMRSIGSAKADPYSAMSGAAAALFGPLHGGANEAVVRMLTEIGDVKNVPSYIERVKKGEFRLMGFGHRVYKNYDPRARIIKKIAYDVFEVTGTDPLLDIALKLEEVALNDEYFISRKLYPNVDFYSGIIYKAMRFPTDMFTVLFALGRAPGWLAQWVELVTDPEQRIARPRQVYLGEEARDYVPLDQR
ncbi:citrate synthase [Litorilinea aerophila]|uniref:Citrate synthase n=1 Tax=Litorilinea aerophila TaxID=1204385 RepID=A0A540VL00_9CHLR|nr:citrate synthase [Litorilinea aerophila]MCC9075129.1 citrate synthase [Litorilinea aerophila]OUC05183.1 citrate synthase [Litorilinea aerophila]